MSLSPSRPPLAGNAISAMHQRRVTRMLLLGSGITAASCVGWGIFFAVRGNLGVVAIDLVAVVLCLIVVRMTLRGHRRAAAGLFLATMYVVLCGNSLLLDVPTEVIPRSTDAFLLALGLVGSLLMRDERPWLRHGVPLLCFVTYAILAGTHLGWVTPMALPESVRASGAWVNHGIAVVTIYAVLHVIQNDAAERNAMEAELRDALLRGEFLLHYQPQVIAGERIVGAEALVRWQHPVRGMVSPGEFIPLAERTGLMLPLGDWVLKTACQQIAEWQQRPEAAGLTVAVNVSALQVAQADFVDKVLGITQWAGIDRSRLKLELTESMLAHDLEDIIAKMTALKAQGIGFSLDDFGTGYSSLSYLRRLPLEQLKIDKSFVATVLHSPKEAAILRTLIALGRSLHIALIAEGVETPEQWRFLQDNGCVCYQGYLCSRPVSSPEFEALLMRANGPLAQAAPADASVAKA